MPNMGEFCAKSAGPTWGDAVAKWRREGRSRTAETQRRELALLNFAALHLDGRALDTIRRADLERLRDAKLGEGRSARTVNYLVQTVTAILRAAVRWEWIDRAPHLEGLRLGPLRESTLTDDQAAALLAALPPYLGRLAEFCLETGLRQGNAKSLEWRHVDRAGNRVLLPAAATKNRAPLAVPLSRRAADILDECRGHHGRFVFVCDGRPISQPTGRAWYRALALCGLEGFRFHDLRHTWASRHMAGGTDALMLQKLGGWRTAQMVSRYAHLQDAAAQSAVARLDSVRSANDHRPPPDQRTDRTDRRRRFPVPTIRRE